MKVACRKRKICMEESEMMKKINVYRVKRNESGRYMKKAISASRAKSRKKKKKKMARKRKKII